MDSFKLKRYLLIAGVSIVALVILYLLLASGSFWLVMLAGLLIVGALVFGYLHWAKGRDQRKALKTADESGSSDPKARLPRLRRSFNRGLEQFSSFGKGVYSLPWYVMIGEDGVGKSEAIRQSGLGFPPGLQEGLKGDTEGGDDCLNWWFTNNAVILEAPGDWLFKGEDDDPQNEWGELCRLLVSRRPRSPFNGIIMTFSARTLLTDSAETTKEKAGKLARRLALAQKILELRFPLYVFVSQCDKLIGFREFFDRASDAERKQILGWTNPAPLDDRYDPGAMENQLSAMLEALTLRQTELLSVVPIDETTSKPKKGWAEAVFALPHQFQMLIPNLKRYLEPAFLLGEWSTRPLFLRGIYFASALRRDAVIDPEVRDGFAMPLEDIDPEKGDEIVKRAYFVHDLLMKKVFEERGLLLHASGAAVSRKVRRFLPWGLGILGTSILIILTIFSRSTLKELVGSEKGYWEAANRDQDWKELKGRWAWKPALTAQPGTSRYGYTGTETLIVEDREDTSAEYLGKLAEKVQKPLDLPWMFTFADSLAGDLGTRRLQAGRALFESSVLYPVVTAATSKLALQGPDRWSPEATNALTQLLRLQVQATLDDPTDAGEELIDLDSLFAYVLSNSKGDFERYTKSHAKILNEAMTKMYAGANTGAWPPAGLDICGPGARKAVKAGVRSFGIYWVNQMGPNKMSRFFSDIATLTEAGTDFLDAEQALVRLARQPSDGGGFPMNLVKHNMVAGEWELQFERLGAARTWIQENQKILETGKLQDKYNEIGESTFAAAEGAVKAMKGLTSLVVEGDVRGDAEEWSAYITELDMELGKRQAILKSNFQGGKVKDRLATLDKDVFAPVAEIAFGKKRRAYEVRYELYSHAYAQLTAKSKVPGLFGLSGALKEVKDSIALGTTAIRRQQSRLAEVPLINDTAEAALIALRLIERGKEFQLLKAALDHARDTSGGLTGIVVERSKATKREPMPKVSMSKMDGGMFDERFGFVVAKELLAEYTAMQSLLKPAEGEPPMLESVVVDEQYKTLGEELEKYFASYLAYWIEMVEKGMTVSPPPYGEYFTRLSETQPWQVNAGLKAGMAVVDEAITGFETVSTKQMAVQIASIRQRIQAGRERVTSELFVGKCKEILRKWVSAVADPDGLRMSLLSMKPADMTQAFLVTGGAADADYVLRYWKDFTYQALVRLGDEYQGRCAEHYPSFKNLEVFPLAGLGERALGTQESYDATKVFGLIRLDTTKLPEGSIGRGSLTGIQRVDDAVARLKSADVPEENRKWFDAANEVAKGLPEERAYECEVSIPSTEEQKGLCTSAGVPYQAASAVRIWRAVAIRQGGNLLTRPAKTEQLAEVSIGKLRYPGKETRIELYTFIDAPPAKTIVEAAPWSCIRLLHDYGAKRSSEKPNSWVVGVSAKDSVGSDRVLWLRLTFARALPKLADWPVSRYAAADSGLADVDYRPRFVPGGAAQKADEDILKEQKQPEKPKVVEKPAEVEPKEPETVVEPEKPKEPEKVAEPVKPKEPEVDPSTLTVVQILEMAATKELVGIKQLLIAGKLDEALKKASRGETTYAMTGKKGEFADMRVEIEKAIAQREKAEDETRQAALAGKVITGYDGIKMVFVPGGEYRLGDDRGQKDEKPSRRIRVDAFYMGMHEITNAQYAKFDPRHKMSPYSQGDNNPVVDVTWRDAYKFCQWLSQKENVTYRLPTEAEWEVAARGNDGRTYPWGNESVDEGDVFRANYREGKGKDPKTWGKDGHAYTAPIGSFPKGASPFGCLDMAGNVWEWCLDYYGENYYAERAPNNPRGPESGSDRIVRGGSWYHSLGFARSANRHKLDAKKPQPTVGFRVLREAPAYKAE